MSMSSHFRTTVNIARKHSRVSVVAAAVAASGVLGAAGFAASAAPKAQAIDNVANIAQAGSQPTSGQPGSFISNAFSGVQARDGKPAASAQGDTHRPDATGGRTGAAPTADGQHTQHTQHTQHQATAPNGGSNQQAPRQAAKPQVPAAPANPYLIYDSVTPSAIPAGQPAAVYANGAYAASPAQLAGHQSVLWIDTNGSDPAANVLDVEPGDATPAGAAQWVQQRLTAQPHAVAIVYTMMSDWQQVKDDVAALPAWMQSNVRYWIADPTGVPHMVPGASATQWYWGNGYDITTANPNFDD
jgi:hypothetical protein